METKKEIIQLIINVILKEGAFITTMTSHLAFSTSNKNYKYALDELKEKDIIYEKSSNYYILYSKYRDYFENYSWEDFLIELNNCSKRHNIFEKATSIAPIIISVVSLTAFIIFGMSNIKLKREIGKFGKNIIEKDSIINEFGDHHEM